MQLLTVLNVHKPPWTNKSAFRLIAYPTIMLYVDNFASGYSEKCIHAYAKERVHENAPRIAQ